MPKDPHKKIAELMEGLDDDDRDQVLIGLLGVYTPAEACRLTEAAMPAFDGLRVADLDDLDDELEAGDDGCVAFEDLAPQERIIADDDLLPVAFLEEGAVRQRAVARIALKEAHRGLPAGSGFGTGWLVSDDLLMTNNHVIRSIADAKKMRAEFNYQNDINGNALTPDRWDLHPEADDGGFFYTNVALDFTLVRIRCRQRFTVPAWVNLGDRLVVREYTPDPNGPVGPIDPTGGFGGFPTKPPIGFGGIDFGDLIKPPIPCAKPGTRWGWLELPSGSVNYAAGQHVNIVQHPGGRRKQVGLQDNEVTNVFTSRLRYTTDTEPGSSGSPVFNNTWDVLAIHHAAGARVDGTWVSNQGIRIDRIVDNIRANVAASVRIELGL